MVQCNACGGTYEPVQADGTRYFHTCAPVPEYFDAQGIPITRDMAEALIKGGGAYRVRSVPRANHRDENPGDARDRTGRALPKAAGAGVTAIVRPVDPLADTELVTAAEPSP